MSSLYFLIAGLIGYKKAAPALTELFIMRKYKIRHDP